MTKPGEPTAGVNPGDVLAGKYIVDRVLGSGGMGVVVAAHHIQLDEKVALKFLLAEALLDPEAISRFEREARAAVKIKSEHVVRVSDVGKLETGVPYMVMEYLEGIDLSEWLAQRGAMPVERAVDFVLQACEAMAEAHTAGIVHRDLKPANLFCIRRADGQLSIKVLDFGISKVTTPGAPGHDMTRTHAVVGSPLYMSPEQMKSSRGVDARSDLWSLAVILFELTTGRVPFLAESVTELAIKVANDEPPRLRAFRPAAPEELEHVIAKCLAKDREHRYQTVGDLAFALREFGSKRGRASVDRVLGTLEQAGLSNPVLARSGALDSDAPPPSAAASMPATVSAWGKTGSGRKPRRRTAMAAGAAVIALGLLSAGGVLLLRKPGPPAPLSSSTPAPSATTIAPQPSVSEAQPDPAPDPPVATASPSTSAAPAVQPTTGTPRPVALPARPVAAAPAPAPAAAVVPKVSCDPPYYFDDKGRRLFKKECL